MKPLTEKKVIVDPYNAEIVEAIRFNAPIESHNAVEFLTDKTIKVCLIQADLSEDALNIATLFKAKSTNNTNITLIDYDLWESDNHKYSNIDGMSTYTDDRTVIGEFYDWLSDIDSDRFIVYGTNVKHLPGYFLTINGSYKDDIRTLHFLSNNAMVILNYHSRNFITKIWHWFMSDPYETIMRELIEYGSERKLIEAEYKMDCKHREVK